MAVLGAESLDKENVAVTLEHNGKTQQRAAAGCDLKWQFGLVVNVRLRPLIKVSTKPEQDHKTDIEIRWSLGPGLLRRKAKTNNCRVHIQ